MTKADLYRLVDKLPESTQETAYRVLKCICDESHGELAAALAEVPEDPLLRALAGAPEDDELETPEEVEALREAEEDIRSGRVVSHEEARRRLLEDV